MTQCRKFGGVCVRSAELQQVKAKYVNGTERVFTLGIRIIELCSIFFVIGKVLEYICIHDISHDKLIKMSFVNVIIKHKPAYTLYSIIYKFLVLE